MRGDRDGRKMRILELLEKQLQAIGALASSPGGERYMGRVLWYLFEVSRNSQITPSSLAEVAAKAGPDADRLARERVEAWQEGLRVEGEKRGLEKERERERGALASSFLEQLEAQFGALTDAQRERLQQMPKTKFDAWIKALMRGTPLQAVLDELGD